jgi:hypothetical protein
MISRVFFSYCVASGVVILLFSYVMFTTYLLLDGGNARDESSNFTAESFIKDGGGANSMAALNIVPIMTTDDSITPLDLYGKFGDIPVIVKGALKDHPLMKKENIVEHLKEVCGPALIDTVVYSSSYSGWAGHMDEKLMPFADFVDGYLLNATSTEIRYGHSNTFGMPLLCPAIQWDVMIPALASKDLPTGGSVRNLGQPTLFLGPAGSKSEMHMDMYLLPFWLSCYLGVKKFRVILFEDSVEHFEGDYMNVGRYKKTITDDSGNKVEKSLEIWDPDLEVFPELSQVRIFEGEAEAGDLIYVPSGALHGVLNTEMAFGATANALFSPVTNHYAEVCTKSKFANMCDECLEATWRKECDITNLDGLNAKSIDDFTACALQSKTNSKHYDSYMTNEGFRDSFLYETHLFDNYQDWCNGNCAQILKEIDDTTDHVMKEYQESLGKHTGQSEFCFKQCSSYSNKPETT